VQNSILFKNANCVFENGTAAFDVLTVGNNIFEIDKNIEPPFKNTEVIDASEMWLAPGLIDQHVHITGGGGEGGFANQVPPLQLSAAVKAGITTIVGLLGTDGTTRSVENLLAKTKGLNEEGITAYCLTGSYEYPSPTITGSVMKDIALINEIIGVKIAISDHRSSNITSDELVKLASQARLGGILSGKAGVVHLHVGGTGRTGLQVVYEAMEKSEVPVSQFKPTHLGGHMDDAIRFASMGGYADVTVSAEKGKTAAIMKRAYAEGLWDRFTMSTDGNGSMPRWNEKKEMIGITAASVGALFCVVQDLVESGMPIWEALLPVTRNPAVSLGIFGKKGKIAVGADADILLINKNMKLCSVYAMGREMMKNGEVIVKGRFE